MVQVYRTVELLNLAVPWPKRTPRQSCAETGPPERYDEDFKNEAVRLVTTGQRSVPDVARSLGISENILYRWKGHTNKVDRSPNGISQQDYDQLREQLRRTEQERDILKKALEAV